MTSYYNRQCQQIITDYRAAGGAWPPKKIELVEWALEHKRWEPSRDDIRRMCGEAIAEAMREDEFTDERGRIVRSMLAATTIRDGEQGTFWDYIRTAPVEFIRVGVAQRRNGIAAECYRLHNIVRYCNDHHDAKDEIQLNLNFTNDVKEMDQPRRERLSEQRTTVHSAIEPEKPDVPPQPAVPPSMSPHGTSRPSSRPPAHV